MDYFERLFAEQKKLDKGMLALGFYINDVHRLNSRLCGGVISDDWLSLVGSRAWCEASEELREHIYVKHGLLGSW